MKLSWPHKNAKKKELGQYSPSLINNASARKLPEGEGGGEKVNLLLFPSHTQPQDLARRRVRKVHSHGFFSTFYCTKQILYVYTLLFSIKENVQHIVK